MALRPFALDDLIINEGVDYSAAGVVSQLVEATGLGQVQPQFAARYGRRPVISGVDLPGRRFFLESWFVDNYWKANKLLLYQYLNAARGETRRLLAGDSVPPGLAMEGCLLALGPWDVYADDAGAWHVRDLLQPDDVEADISGAVHFIDADRTSAEVVAAATINYLHNPVAGGSSGYTNHGSGAVSRTSSYDLYSDCDEYAYQVDCLAEHDGGEWTLDALANAIHYVSFWRRDTEALSLQVSLDGTNWHTATSGQTSGLWTRYGAQIPAAQANGSTTLYIRTTGGAYTTEPGVWVSAAGAWSVDAADADAWTSFDVAVTLLLDGLQVEAATVVTDLVWGGLSGYSWDGTAHDSATIRDWHVDAGEGYDSRSRAIVIEEATTNLVKNPVAGAVGNIGNIASGTSARSLDVYLFDRQNLYSFKVTTTGDGDGATWTLAAAANEIHYVTFWQYGQAPNDLQVSLDNSNWHDVSESIADGDWTRYGAQIPAAQANGSTTLYLKQNGVGAGSFYVDGMQVEENEGPTSLCHGDMGEGYAWDSTEHASKSTRAKTEVEITDCVANLTDCSCLTIRMKFQFPYGCNDTDQWYFLGARVLDYGALRAWLEPSVGHFRVNLSGGAYLVDLDASSLGWEAGDWIDLIFAVDFGGLLRVYWNGEQIGCSAISGGFSTTTGYIGSADFHANLTIAEFAIYDRVLTHAQVQRLHNNDPWRARWLDVLAENPQPRSEGGRRLAFATVTPLAVDGDIRWRSRDGDVAFWRIYDATADLQVAVESDDEVYPEIRITPTAARDSGFLYKRWCPVIWQSDYAGVNYPVSIEPPNLGGYVQTNGNDLRVYDGSVEIDRWLLGDIPNAMQVWVNLDFAPRAVLALVVAIAESENVGQITVTGDIANMPQSGVLLIGTEAFTYTGKSTADKTFTGVVRGTRGTTEAEHAAGAGVYWIQHDLMLYYGDDTLGSPDVDNDYAPMFVYQPRETGDDKDLLGGWDGITGIMASNTDGGVLYVIVVYDGGSTFHVELYKDAGCASGDLVGHTAGYTSTGAQAVVADNGSGLSGTILIESVDGPAILETGDDQNRLSDWDDITGVTPYNTDNGVLYVSIIYDGVGYSHVDLYKNPGKASGDKVGHTATYNSTGSKAIVADNGSGLGGTITVDSVGSFVESGDVHEYLSGWDSITGITTSNTDDYVLYARVVRDGGGFFHVALYKDAARAAGDLVGHTATYNSTGAKTVIADNGSGLGGTITVDSVGSIIESGDTNSQLSGWDNITGLDEDNTDEGKLYTAIVRDGSGYYHLAFFKDNHHYNLVGHTATYNSTGAKAVVADNGSGLGGTITVDSLTMPTPWDSGDDDDVLSGWENLTGITYAVCGRGSYGGYIRAQVDGLGSPYHVVLLRPIGTTWTTIAHTADYSTTGVKTLYEDFGSGVGGTVTVSDLMNALCTVWMDFAVETTYGLAGGIQVQFAYGKDIQATFDFGIEVEWGLDSGDSSNYEWTFLRFGENDGLRSAAWQCSIGVQDGDNLGRYTGDYGSGEQYADPWEEIGLDLAASWKQFWSFYSPCEIVNANFEDGEYETSEANRKARIDSSKDGVLWQEEHDIAPTGTGTWVNWSQDVALKVGSRYVRMYGQAIKLECDKVTLTFNAARVPIVSVYAQQDNYALACTITNETTGEAIEVAANIEVDTLLIVDTKTKTVRLADGTKMQHALEADSVRREWLRLLPGVNDLDFAETGADELKIDIVWERRYFE